MDDEESYASLIRIGEAASEAAQEAARKDEAAPEVGFVIVVVDSTDPTRAAVGSNLSERAVAALLQRQVEAMAELVKQERH